MRESTMPTLQFKTLENSMNWLVGSISVGTTMNQELLLLPSICLL